MAFLAFSIPNLVLTLFASVVTATVAPVAAGSGIPEVKAYLNGVDAPGILSFRTLVIKVRLFILFILNWLISKIFIPNKAEHLIWKYFISGLTMLNRKPCFKVIPRLFM